MSFLEQVSPARRNVIGGILLLGVTVCLSLSLVSYDAADFPFKGDVSEKPANVLGVVGAVVAHYSFLIAGYAPLALCAVLCMWSVRMLLQKEFGRIWMRVAGVFLLIFTLSCLLDIARFSPETPRPGLGGVLGSYLADKLVPWFDMTGAVVMSGTLLIIALLLSTDLLLVAAGVLLTRAMVWTGKMAFSGCRQAAVALLPGWFPEEAEEPRARGVRHAPERRRRVASEPRIVMDRGKGAVRESEAPASDLGLAQDVPLAFTTRYKKPPLDILAKPTVTDTHGVGEDLRKVSALLEETLETFGVEAEVVQVTRGPTVTRYELEPAPGIKVNKFMALADDIALALKAHRVRVEAPIPGKGRVGIEVPNDEREEVLLRDILTSPAFRKSKSKLTIALGKDVAGEPVVVDITSLPHLLIAGATGSGKTICVKSIIATMLFNTTPDEVQLLLIDPKMVELSVFSGIPHLIVPVVTDAKKAAMALEWLIREMESRYRLFAGLRYRNIDVYNEKVASGEVRARFSEMSWEPGPDGEGPPEPQRLPYIVVFIDELADLMALTRAEVENSIARLSQLARAVGIHLVLATQRPSVDVLTGVIKNNFPGRISFQVSSKVDSRTILDMMGAERLTGKGDMLYFPAGAAKPMRIQGAYVADSELTHLVAHLKRQGPPRYRKEIVERPAEQDFAGNGIRPEKDELYDEAVRIVCETGQASISMLQRRMKVGYARAARIIDQMELEGIIGPPQGSQAREILINL